MNVLRPEIDAKVRLPIFLWVHGGSYKHGNGSGEIWGDMMQYDGRYIFFHLKPEQPLSLERKNMRISEVEV